LCAFGGLRLGECAALKVSDVDFLKREIDVRRQVQRANQHQVEIRAPKYGSERTIYAPDALITMLSEHVRLYRPGDDPDRWLFTRRVGPAAAPELRRVLVAARQGCRWLKLPPA
jgi:integrase